MPNTKMVNMFPFSSIVQSEPQTCETVSGKYIDVMNPDVNLICINDIAWALSRQPRYAGHNLGEIYHVAQHAVFVKSLLESALSGSNPHLVASYMQWMNEYGNTPSKVSATKNFLRQALCHDNTEAYLVDLPSPIKRHSALRGPYKEVESRLHNTIEEALELEPLSVDEAQALCWADLMALQIEAANIMPSRGRGWGVMPQFDLTMMDLMPTVLPWNQARELFLNEYIALR